MGVSCLLAVGFTVSNGNNVEAKAETEVKVEAEVETEAETVKVARIRRTHSIGEECKVRL